ncbi:MAG: c-type cytochrome [Bacteroidales bacterium]|jgi:mono/diheme cytochrome c family protein|nr:c-type cytochrome [Bacteroidales bacterium]
MKKLLKIFLWFVLVIVIIIVIAVGYIQLSWNKTFDAPYPDITASNDPAMIERGKYLAYGWSHCAACHVPADKVREVENGLEMPLIGGWDEEIAGFGTFRAPNLTPDPETGIGRMTDGELARAIRYCVKHDGKLLPPFMVFQGLSDEDLTAVISFLRSQEPVKNQVAPSDYGFVAKAVIAFGLLKPQGPKSTPPKSIRPDTTAVYGEYLATSVGNCLGCHVKIDQAGNQVNPDFAGGGIFPPTAFSKGYGYVSPNLTPDKKTGAIADWSEEQFVDRFQGGRLHEGSPMPWNMYSRMSVNDMKAIYRFLHTLDPVGFSVEKTVYQPGEKMPQ